jgi:outer membrane murein-binding lipoprotein Lpp
VICSIALVALVVLASLYCCCRHRAAGFRPKQGEPTAAQFQDLESRMQELQVQVAMLQAERSIDHADVKATKMEKERMSKVGVNRDRNSGMSYTGDEDARSVAPKSNPPKYDA